MKRFDGKVHDEYQTWKMLAQAHILSLPSTHDKKTIGPMLFKLFDGDAADAFEDMDFG